MAQPKPFTPVKLICGVIAGNPTLYDRTRDLLRDIHGPADLESPPFPFDLTDYYAPDMGQGLTRRFLSFEHLVEPERLPAVKLETNRLEDAFRAPGQDARPVNIDPGYLTASALVMATTKDFSHRIPLTDGIYAHLEFLFTKTGVRTLDWTYPDMRRGPVQAFFLEVRKKYLSQLR